MVEFLMEVLADNDGWVRHAAEKDITSDGTALHFEEYDEFDEPVEILAELELEVSSERF